MKVSHFALVGFAACSAAIDAPSATSTPDDAGAAWSVTGHDAAVAPGDADEGEPETSVGADHPTSRTTIRVHYAGIPGTLRLRGSGGSLSWDVDTLLTAVGDDTYEWSSADVAAALDFKPRLDEAWSLGPNYHAEPGQAVDVAPRFQVDHGQVDVRWPAFTSHALPSTRAIRVYLPPTYLENTAARFDVLYMHDGQNLFSADTAFGGHEWQVDEAMDQGAADGSVHEAVVIGVDSTENRLDELTPTVDPGEGQGGQADAYLSMVQTELMPLVAGELRVLAGPAHTAMMGSSLGGLCSVYAGVHHADVYGRIGALSPSTWWDDRVILGQVASLPAAPRPSRVYVDSGNAGPSDDDVTNTAALAQTFLGDGYVADETLRYVVANGAQHSEIYWAARLPGALAFVLGPR